MRQLWFPDVEKRQWVGIFAGSKSTRTELKLKITNVTAISIKKVLREYLTCNDLRLCMSPYIRQYSEPRGFKGPWTT
ncbi:hypothetical protein HZ326_17130 [Fusarium oxysporum f. sp. albedinis]|nr:hypothetical protein HZ326_17130 [Fusarium oxysporum f. sp. albedinis]